MESNHHRSAKETLANDLRKHIATELGLQIISHPAYEFVKARLAPTECAQFPQLENLTHWPDELSSENLVQTFWAFADAISILSNKLNETPWPTKTVRNGRVPDIFFEIEVGNDEWLLIDLDYDCVGELLTKNYWVYVELPFIEFSSNKRLAAHGLPNFFLTWDWLKKEGRTFSWLVETLEEEFQKTKFSSENDYEKLLEFIFDHDSDVFGGLETRLRAFGEAGTDFNMPSYQRCISVGVRPTLIADITIWRDCKSIPNFIHKSGSYDPIIIEVVHRNGISDRKIKDLKRLSEATNSRIICHEIPANSIQYKTTPIVRYWKLTGAKYHTFESD